MKKRRSSSPSRQDSSSSHTSKSKTRSNHNNYRINQDTRSQDSFKGSKVRQGKIRSTKNKKQAHHTITTYIKPKQVDPPNHILTTLPPQIIAERDGWIVLSKPAGWLTHPDGQKGAGQRPDLVSWAQTYFNRTLGVHQRLDVSTSGLIAFSYTKKGVKVLQNALKQTYAKTYLAVVEGKPHHNSGEINQEVPRSPKKEAISNYKLIHHDRSWSLLQVQPLTGRTHQIRAHCASLGTPIRGDGLYGDPFDLRAQRALLHAYKLVIAGEEFIAEPPHDFLRYLPTKSSEEQIQQALKTREILDDPSENTCYRLFNGDPEGFHGWRLDRYGDWLWLIHDQNSPLGPFPTTFDTQGIYRLEALVDRSSGQQTPPVLWQGQLAPQPLLVREAGVEYLVELGDQLSTGLFLDQRPQRTWLAKASKPWGRVLNTFAHAGGFSIAAAVAGAETVSIDLSDKWLKRVNPQLEANGINTQNHQCLTGDVFDWCRRLQKRGEKFDLIILDPPSTSVGKKKKRWSAARDYPELVQLVLPLLQPGGQLLTCTNHRKLTPHKFAKALSTVMPNSEGFRLERVCAPGIDFPTDEPLPVKNLLWKAPR